VTTDLWGDIPEPEAEKTPFAILTEQASLLQEKTKGLLKGRVTRIIKEGSGQLCYMLEIVAPKLDNYSFGVLIISYDIDTIYPVTLECLVTYEDKDEDDIFTCESEEEFLSLLGNILSSKEVKKVIQRLLLHIESS
jgi:hypothetical protein